MPIDPVQLTRQLMDIDSTSGSEAACGHFLLQFLRNEGYAVEPIHVPVTSGPERFNVYAGVAYQQPDVVLSTHMDTVPPYISGSEDENYLYGRGSCDAKGIIASQVAAAEKLSDAGEKVALLFTVGEEKDSVGAKTANLYPKGNRFLINGEPTDNRIALASKGTLRITLRSSGKMAHSAYPELGDSAIHKLVGALESVLALPLPVEQEAGPCTLNVGTIHGGYAANVIADQAEAKVLVRLVGPGAGVLQAIEQAVAGRAQVLCEPENPFVRFKPYPGMPTMVASFATDVPSLSAWGEPLLFGPGSIHVAHTPDEKLSKQEMFAAIDHYVAIARRLVHGGSMNAGQRIGLGMVALLYGELVAAPVFMLAILLRFPSNWAVLAHHPRFTLLYLGTATAFEGLTAAITWFLFGTLLVWLWRPASMRAHRWTALACSLPLAALAPAVLAVALLRMHRTQPQLPVMSRVLFVETFSFMLISAITAIWRYMKMSHQAEKVLAADGEFRY